MKSVPGRSVDHTLTCMRFPVLLLYFSVTTKHVSRWYSKVSETSDSKSCLGLVKLHRFSVIAFTRGITSTCLVQRALLLVSGLTSLEYHCWWRGLLRCAMHHGRGNKGLSSFTHNMVSFTCLVCSAWREPTGPVPKDVIVLPIRFFIRILRRFFTWWLLQVLRTGTY